MHKLYDVHDFFKECTNYNVRGFFKCTNNKLIFDQWTIFRSAQILPCTVTSESNARFENENKNKNICIFSPVYTLVKNLYLVCFSYYINFSQSQGGSLLKNRTI
jgi:hypothetical protein